MLRTGSGEPRFTGRPRGGAHQQQQYHPPMQRQSNTCMEGVASVEQDDSTINLVIVAIVSCEVSYHMQVSPILDLKSVCNGNVVNIFSVCFPANKAPKIFSI